MLTYEQRLNLSRKMVEVWNDPTYVDKVMVYKHGERCGALTPFQKLHIRNRYGRNCVLCGKSEVFNGNQLSLHHISGDPLVQGDGQPWMLSLLCEDCHKDIHEESFDTFLKTLVVFKAFELAFEKMVWTRRNDYVGYESEPLLC